MINTLKSYLPILACPVCRGKLKKIRNKLHCLNCGEEYLVKDNIPILCKEPAEPDLKETILKWDSEYEDKKLNPNLDLKRDKYLQSSIRHIKKNRPPKKGLFLEVGCGSAKNSALLAQEGSQVIGIDISYKGCLVAQNLFQRYNLSGLFVCGNILSMPFQNNTFNYMYAGGAIEHFKNTTKALQELYRVLKPQGKLSATVPYISLATPYWLLSGNIPNLPILKDILEYFHLKITRGKYLMYGYEKSFTKHQIVDLFNQTGFKKIEAGAFETYLEMKFVKNESMKNIFRRLAQSRLFTPMIYINGQK